MMIRSGIVSLNKQDRAAFDLLEKLCNHLHDKGQVIILTEDKPKLAMALSNLRFIRESITG